MNEKKPIFAGSEKVTPENLTDILDFVTDRAKIDSRFERVVPDARTVFNSFFEFGQAAKVDEHYHGGLVTTHPDSIDSVFIPLEISKDLVPGADLDGLHSPAFGLEEPDKVLLEMTHAFAKTRPMGSDIDENGFGTILSEGEYKGYPLYIIERYEDTHGGPIMFWNISSVPIYYLHPSYAPVQAVEKQTYITTNQQQELEELEATSSVTAHDVSLDFINSLPRDSKRRVMDLLREKPEIVEAPDVLRTWVRGRIAA